MTPEGKFMDPEIHCSKFGDLNNTSCQAQGPSVNFSLAAATTTVWLKDLLDLLLPKAESQSANGNVTGE
jgi:hypothetical protein